MCADQAVHLAGIVLAAGGSSRLGQPKQLLPHAQGTLVAHAVKLAQPFCDLGVNVVAGANAALTGDAITGANAALILNEDWAQGMSSSLRAGLAAVPPAADGALLMLCDQPLLQASDIATLVDVWQNKTGQPVAAEYNNVVGAPAVLPAARFTELLQTLEADKGAGTWLRNCADTVSVPMPNAGFDIDTPADLRAYSELRRAD